MACARVRRDASFGIEAGHLRRRCPARSRRSRPPGASRRRRTHRRGAPCRRSRSLSKPLMRNCTAWPGWMSPMRSADTRPFEAHAGRVDHLQQFLADGRGVAGRGLAVAHHPVEGRANLGAGQLLAGGRPCAGIGGHAIALRAVAAHLGVVEGLLRAHPLGLQRLHTGVGALRLVECLGRGAAGFLGGTAGCRGSPCRRAAPAGRPSCTDLSVLLEHLQHDGGDLGPQVGAPFGLDGAGDDRAGRVVLQAPACGCPRARSASFAVGAADAALAAPTARGAWACSRPAARRQTPWPRRRRPVDERGAAKRRDGVI